MKETPVRGFAVVVGECSSHSRRGKKKVQTAELYRCCTLPVHVGKFFVVWDLRGRAPLRGRASQRHGAPQR